MQIDSIEHHMQSLKMVNNRSEQTEINGISTLTNSPYEEFPETCKKDTILPPSNGNGANDIASITNGKSFTSPRLVSDCDHNRKDVSTEDSIDLMKIDQYGTAQISKDAQPINELDAETESTSCCEDFSSDSEIDITSAYLTSQWEHKRHNVAWKWHWLNLQVSELDNQIKILDQQYEHNRLTKEKFLPTIALSNSSDEELTNITIKASITPTDGSVAKTETAPVPSNEAPTAHATMSPSTSNGGPMIVTDGSVVDGSVRNGAVGYCLRTVPLTQVSRHRKVIREPKDFVTIDYLSIPDLGDSHPLFPVHDKYTKQMNRRNRNKYQMTNNRKRRKRNNNNNNNLNNNKYKYNNYNEDSEEEIDNIGNNNNNKFINEEDDDSPSDNAVISIPIPAQLETLTTRLATRRRERGNEEAPSPLMIGDLNIKTRRSQESLNSPTTQTTNGTTTPSTPLTRSQRRNRELQFEHVELSYSENFNLTTPKTYTISKDIETPIWHELEDYFKDFNDIGINGNIGNGDDIGNNSNNSITINVDNSLDFISPIENNNDSSAEDTSDENYIQLHFPKELQERKRYITNKYTLPLLAQQFPNEFILNNSNLSQCVDNDPIPDDELIIQKLKNKFQRIRKRYYNAPKISRLPNWKWRNLEDTSINLLPDHSDSENSSDLENFLEKIKSPHKKKRQRPSTRTRWEILKKPPIIDPVTNKPRNIVYLRKVSPGTPLLATPATPAIIATPATMSSSTALDSPITPLDFHNSLSQISDNFSQESLLSLDSRDSFSLHNSMDTNGFNNNNNNSTTVSIPVTFKNVFASEQNVVDKKNPD